MPGFEPAERLTRVTAASHGGSLDTLTLGVEEEFLVVDAATGALVPRSHTVLPAARQALGKEVCSELNLCQIEVGTPVCDTLEEVRAELTRLRRELTAVAADEESAAAVGAEVDAQRADRVGAGR